MHFISKIGKLVVTTILGLGLITTSLPIHALPPPPIEHLAKAQALGQLKIMVPSSPSTGAATAAAFELNKPATRLQAAHILVRLMAIEGDVAKATYTHPFIDIPAASGPVIGFLYTHGFVTDNATHTFKPQDPLDLNTYASLLLRALGYQSEAGDYTWQNAPDKAVQFGLLSANDLKLIKAQGMMRDELALMTYNALKTKVKTGYAGLPSPAGGDTDSASGGAADSATGGAASGAPGGAASGAPGKTLVDLGIDAKLFPAADAVMAGLANKSVYDAQLHTPIYEVSFINVVVDKNEIYITKKFDSSKFIDYIKATDPTTTEYFSNPNLEHRIRISSMTDFPGVLDIKYEAPPSMSFKKTETYVEYNFYKAGKPVMAVSSFASRIPKDNSYTTPYYVSTPKVAFDQITVSVYSVSPYEVFRTFGNIPVSTYQFKNIKDVVKKMQGASYITVGPRISTTDIEYNSYTGQVFNALHTSTVTGPNLAPIIPMRTTTISGKKVIDNLFMNTNKIVAPKKITVTKSNETSWFSSTMANGKNNGSYNLTVNPNQTSYFVLRDAKFNPTAIICIKP